MAMNESCNANREAGCGGNVGATPVHSRSAIPSHSDKKKKKKMLKKTLSGKSNSSSSSSRMNGTPSPHPGTCSPAPTRVNNTNNNYAAPHTPIASAKRPRHKPTPVSSGTTAPLTPRSQIVDGTTPMATTPMAATPPRSELGDRLPPASKFSPMHPPTSARLQAHVRGVKVDENVDQSKLYLDLDDSTVTKLAPSGTISMNASEEESPVADAASASSGGRWGMGQLFSPVLNFLGGGGTNSDVEEERGQKRRQKQQRSPHQQGEETDEEDDDQDDDHDACQANRHDYEDGGAETAETAETADETVDEDGDVNMSEDQIRLRSPRTEHSEGDTAAAERDGNGSGLDGTSRDKSGAPLLTPSSSTSMENAQVPSKVGTAETEVSAEECYEDANQGQVTVHHHTNNCDPQGHQEQQEQHVDPNDDAAAEDEEDEDEFNPYLFIKHLPPYHTVAPPWAPMHAGSHPHVNGMPPNGAGFTVNGGSQYTMRNGWYALPPKDKSAPPVTLVLDLDETLVHCTVEDVPDADLTFPVLFGGIEYTVRVKLRPHLAGFLRRVSQRFEVIVFTASQRVYADELLNRIDPHHKLIRHRLFRESCLPVEGNYLKDLHVLGPSRSLRRTVLVDNSPHAFGYQIDNGIPIESWFDDPHDTELLKLEEFLERLHGVPDVRHLVRNKFRTHLLVHNA